MKRAYIQDDLLKIKEQEELIEQVVLQKGLVLGEKALEQIREYNKAQTKSDCDAMFICRNKYYAYVDAIAIVTGKNEAEINNDLLNKSKEITNDN